MKAYMEWAAACWNQWQEGDINISFNPDKPGYLHDHFIGLNYEVNLSKPAGERIENVTFQGKPLADDQVLTLCVNDYRYTGLKNEGIISGEKEWESPNSVRDMLVAYLAEHDPLQPTVDNNWKITGVDLSKDDPRRQEIINLINVGKLDTPYNKSYNLADYDALIAEAQSRNVIVDGNAFQVDSAVSSGLGDTVFYRLRDLAVAFNGTPAMFNVEWNGQVAITKGSEYTAASLAPRPEGSAIDYANITIQVDGVDVETSTLLIGGNYYVSADGLNTLLGVSAVEADGVLTVTTK